MDKFKKTKSQFYNYYGRIINRAQIEARLGRKGYNEILIKYAKRLHTLIDQQGLLAELDKNTLVISTSLDSQGNMELVERFFQAALNIPYHNTLINMDIKYGISAFPKDGEEPQTLISKAQMALNFTLEHAEYEYYEYEAALEENLKRESVLQSGLVNALKNNEIMVYYQPKIDTKKKFTALKHSFVGNMKT